MNVTPVILIGLGLIITIGLIFKGIWAFNIADNFNRNSVVTQGIITYRWSTIMSSTLIRGRAWSNDYFVEYLFEVPTTEGKSQQYIQKQSVHESLYYSLQIGDIVEVRYLPTNPEKSRIF